MGVSTNLEGFAKSVFNQKTLNTFNKLNTVWLVAYFFVLQTLQSFDLEGVMASYIVFYWMRCFIAVALASSVNPHLHWRFILAKFIPAPIEFLSYGAALYVSYTLMASFSQSLLGFGVCGILGVIHLLVVAFSYRSELREFKRAINN